MTLFFKMFIEILKSKIAYARITEAQLYYEGSITIDEDLLKAVDVIPGEKVTVLNLNTGARFETYTIKGKAGSGEICLNGPAARLGVLGDEVIILSYGLVKKDETADYETKIIHVDENNRIKNESSQIEHPAVRRSLSS
jgi:aspartate 1-decarboxylase